ncbi:MAG: DsbA family oxidoreductase [Rhodospirillales bacterium]
MKLDIVVDTICPWCFIGKRRLEEAMEGLAGEAVEIRCRPFVRTPDLPDGGIDRQTYLSTKFGGEHRAERVYDSIRRAGQGNGIDFAFDRIQRTPNSVDSHRLIRFAERHASPDACEAMVEQLFEAYFLEGRDIGDLAVLTEIGVAAGLDREALSAYLASDEDRAEIYRENAEAHRLGVTGVPCFILDDKYAIAGAQEAEVLRRMFQTAAEGALSAQSGSA